MKSIHHSFDIDLAAVYGVHEAILIHHFQHWITFNRKLKKNLIEGRTWTYQTRQEICAYFSYLSEKEIRGAIDRLVAKKVIIKGNFNKTPFDRTTWFAFVNEDEFLNKVYDGPKGPMERAKGPIREVQKGPTIPDTITDAETSSSSLPPSQEAIAPTQEEEEEVEKRLRERPKDMKPILSLSRWKQAVLEDLRGTTQDQQQHSVASKKHRAQALQFDGRQINGDRITVTEFRVEFTAPNFYKLVPFDLPEDLWHNETIRWFGS